MLKTHFIVGTDTSCGKTYVTAALITYFRNQNQPTIGLKPIASGCKQEAGNWVNDDVLIIQQANGPQSMPICKWLMPEPISPHLAARAAGISLSAVDIYTFCNTYPATKTNHLLIEGAGGLMVPLNEDETWIDVLKLSQWPVIIVVGMRLGCINHALLTTAVLQYKGITCAGWIANYIDPLMRAQDKNVQTLTQKIPYPLLGTVPFDGVFIPFESI